jgi:hypothetical protein
MSDIAQDVHADIDEVPSREPSHDHAWRKVHLDTSDPFRIVGEYRCDLCSATWSM